MTDRANLIERLKQAAIESPLVVDVNQTTQSKYARNLYADAVAEIERLTHASGAEGEAVAGWLKPDTVTLEKVRTWRVEADKLLNETMEGPYSVIVALADYILRPEAGERNAVIETAAYERAARVAHDVIVGTHLPRVKRTQFLFDDVAAAIRALASTPAPEPKAVKPKKTRTLIERLKDLYVCDFGCEGWCRECPQDVVREAIAALEATPAPDTGREGKLREALARIAFDDDVSQASSDSSKEPSWIAYVAIGGRIEEGRRLDNRQTLSLPPASGENTKP